MTNRLKRAFSSLGVLAVLALSSTTATAGPMTTPGDYSLTIYDPNYNVVYQIEVAAASVNPNTIYDFNPTNSITIGSTSYLLWNISIFSSGALEFPNQDPTAIYAAGGNPITGPWDAIFGLVYDTTSTWDGNSINYYLGFAAGPPGTGTPYAPDGAATYDSEASGPFVDGITGLFTATLYLATDLQSMGYTADFYDPFSQTAPEPASLTLLGLGGAVLAVAGWRRRRKLRAQVA